VHARARARARVCVCVCEEGICVLKDAYGERFINMLL